MLIHERGLEAHDGEDDGAGIDGGEPVAERHEDGVLLHVVLHGVVGGEGDEAAERQTEGEEDLSGGVQPALWVHEVVHLQSVKDSVSVSTRNTQIQENGSGAEKITANVEMQPYERLK